MLQRTIILTSSIRVEAETEEELSKLGDALCTAADTAFDGSKVLEGLKESTSVGDITTDFELVDDEDED